MQSSRINTVLSAGAKETIRKDLETQYVRGARLSIAERDAWRTVADVTETLAKVLAGVTSIVSFAASTYKNPALSFSAGCIGTAGVTLAGFSSYALKESRERLARLNTILQDVDVRPVQDDDPPAAADAVDS